MATKTKKQTGKRPARSGGRITGGRASRARHSRAKPGGPRGLLNQITGQLGRTGGRGSRGGSSLATKAAGFVSGFLSSGGKSGRRRR